MIFRMKSNLSKTAGTTSGFAMFKIVSLNHTSNLYIQLYFMNKCS